MGKVKIGVPMRYYRAGEKQAMMGCITESTRRALQAEGAEVVSILPVQDVALGECSYTEIPKLTEVEKQEIIKQIQECDGVFLPGGQRFMPYDHLIVDYVIEQNIPVLGVCMGMQLLNSFHKTTVDVKRNDDSHAQKQEKGVCHEIKIDRNSRLFEILGKEKTEVNSFHHYQIVENPEFRAVAKSPDGVIEAIERGEGGFCLGVQWHPERDYGENADSQKIMRAFIDAVKKYQRD